jgi:hypothetical protein
MAEHDADMTRFSQWWRRSKRSGHASMQNLALRGLDGRSHGRQVVTRAILWAVVAPLLALAVAGFAITRGRADLGLVSLAALAGLWILKVLRVALRRHRQGESLSGAILYATFNWLAKFAEALGVIQFLVSRARGREPDPVEYKSHQGSA